MVKKSFHSIAAVMLAAAMITGCNEKKSSNNDLVLLAALAGSGSGIPTYNTQVITGMAIQTGVMNQSLSMLSYTLMNSPDAASVPDYTDFEPGNTSGPSPSVMGSGADVSKSAAYDYSPRMNFTGPDASGWYSQYYKFGGYTYSWRYRTVAADHKFEYQFSISASDASSSYSYEVVETSTMDADGLITGNIDTTQEASGTVTYSVRWNFTFAGWDPATGAGTFDWYWSADSLGADPVFYHKYLNIIATDNGDGTLHVIVTWYDDSGVEVNSFDYDTLSYYTISVPSALYGY